MLSFSGRGFKWSVHVFDALNQVHGIHTWFSYCFTIEVNLFISWL